MLLPDGENAQVDRAKITEYLLSASHPDGRSKAAFFMQFGFRVEEWGILASALKQLGTSNPVSSTVESQYGARYTVDGPLTAPDGRAPLVRTVWIAEPGHPPRLITAYPF
jgi:hypothetical protein